MQNITLAQLLEQETEHEKKIRAELEAEYAARPSPVVVEKIIERTAKDEILKLKSEGATKEEIAEAMKLLIDEHG